MLVNIEQKIFVITGSSRGIGAALAYRVAVEGGRVVINYNESKADAVMLASKIKNAGGDAIIVKADVTKENEVKIMYEKVLEEYGRVDILINNAGILCDSNIANMEYEKWKKVVDVNLSGCFLCCKYFSKNMIQNKQGKIINIGSFKGQVGTANQINYTTSKSALVGFTKTLAREFGAYNVSVNCICPGFIKTDLNKFCKKKETKAKEQSLMNLDYTLENLLNYIVLLSSDKIDGVSGQIFNIDSRVI